MKTKLVMLTKTILRTTRHVPRLAGLMLLALLAFLPAAWAETTNFTTVGTNVWVVPANVSLVTVECWGGGGAAGSAKSIAGGTQQGRSGGGGGGSFARRANLAVTAGQTYNVIVGAGGLSYTNDIALVGHNYVDPTQAGVASAFTSSDYVTTYALATGGAGGGNALKTTAAHTPATGGSGAVGFDILGDFIYAGGNGGSPGTQNSGHSGGGGGGAGDANAGGNAAAAPGTTGGVGGLVGGGNGGNGRGAAGAPQTLPTAPGGGGGGVVAVTSNAVWFGAAGAPGQVRLTYAIDLGVDHYAVTVGSPQTAGVPFNVTITAQDASNVTVPDSINTVTATSPGSLMEFDWNGDGSYGDNSGTLTNGVGVIKARDKRAETVSIEATAGAVITTSPPFVTIDPAAFTKLQLLALGETAVPATPTGKTGSAVNQAYGVAFDVFVNAVDEFWNVVPSVTDTVGITATDPGAVIPAPAPLLSGQGTINLTLNTIGTNTLTASDLTPGNGTQSPSTSAVYVTGFPIVWQGDGAANLWDTSALNWTNVATGSNVAFIPGIFAQFDDTSTNPVVDIVGTVLPGSITVNSTNDFTLLSTSGGSIGRATNFPANSLTKLGSGTLTIATSNSYSGGTSISGDDYNATNEFGIATNLAGALRVTASQALGSGTVSIGFQTGNPGRLEVSGGITLSNNITMFAKAETNGFVPAIRNIDGTNTLAGTMTQALGGNYYQIQSDSGLLILGTPGTTAYNYVNTSGNRRLILSGAGDGLVLGDLISPGGQVGSALIKEGLGTWTLSGTGNSYKSNTIINAGTLKLGTNNVIPNGSGKLNVINNATLNLNGFTESINGLFGSGIVEGGVGPNLFQVGSDNVSSTFDGVIQNTSGTLTFAKIDTGTLTLTNAHTFSGIVRVGGGTLALTGSASFNNVTTLEVATTATLDVSGLASGALTLGANQTLQRSGSTVGPITVTGNLNMGSGSLLLALNTANLPNTNDSLAVSGTFTPGGTLTVTNIGPALVAGDSFQLFPGAVSGFSVVNLQTNDPANNIASYTWNNTLSTDGKITVATVTSGVNPNPPTIQSSVSGNTLSLAWPTNAGWTLLTNSVSLTVTNQWFPYPNSANLTNVNIPIDPAKTNVFFKMQYPYP